VFAFSLRSRSKIELAVVAVLVSALVVVLVARKPDRARAAALVAVTCGQTITASITVTNDLMNCPGDGLVIGHDSITITLTGHTIDGNSTGNGVNVGLHKSVIVQGGTIQQFFYGVYIGGSTNTVKSARLTGNAIGVYVAGGSGNTVTLNNAYSNSGYGVSVNGLSTKVTSNTFASNTSNGLIVGAPSSVITGNHALNNGSVGIYVNSAATGATITSNVANGNSVDGIRSDSVLATFTTNTANYNTQLGFKVAPGSTDGNGNKAHDNGTAVQCLNVVCP
jgi:parallel beta-helix repeat protein